MRLMIVFVIVLTLAPVFAIVRPAHAQGSPSNAATHQSMADDAQQQVIVQVTGASCPFCAFGLEKRLGQIEGVAQVQMDLKGGQATVTLKPGAHVSDESFRQAVDEAGFTPGAVIRPSGHDGQ